MSKYFATIPGVPVTQAEDECLHRWKYLQKYSRDIVSNAITMVTAKDGLTKLSAQLQLQAAVENFTRLGGKVEDIV